MGKKREGEREEQSERGMKEWKERMREGERNGK